MARFLLFERTYPDSVAACVDELHDVLTMADAGPRNSKPVLRIGRLAADLDFQRRALPERAELGGICEGDPAGARADRPDSPSDTSPGAARRPAAELRAVTSRSAS